MTTFVTLLTAVLYNRFTRSFLLSGTLTSTFILT